MSIRTLALAAALALAPLPALAFTAVNGLVVQPDAGDRFTIPWRGLSGAGAFWCAAGDYVIRGRHLSPTARIWRISPPPRRQGQGITFALSPEGAAGRTGLLALPDDGSLSANAAEALCETRLRWRR